MYVYTGIRSYMIMITTLFKQIINDRDRKKERKGQKDKLKRKTYRR